MANKTGDVDTSFTAHCPKCGEQSWVFGLSDDSRLCITSGCGYVHWLRGEHKSEVIAIHKNSPLAGVEVSALRKRERVRALAHSLIIGGYPFKGAVEYAVILDDQIESIK